MQSPHALENLGTPWELQCISGELASLSLSSTHISLCPGHLLSFSYIPTLNLLYSPTQSWAHL